MVFPIDIDFLPSPCSSDSIHLSDSSPQLDLSTLAILDTYLQEKAEQERLLAELAGVGREDENGRKEEDEDEDERQEEEKVVSVDEFKLAFGEDWQLSQFWYDTTFAYRLARHLYALCTTFSTSAKTPTIAFMCAPTAFVAFRHLPHFSPSLACFPPSPYSSTPRSPLRTPAPAQQFSSPELFLSPPPHALLLEYDTRFSILDPARYVKYDLHDPHVVPVHMKGSVDVVLVDPPYLNESTNTQIIHTLRYILHPRSKVVLITSTAIEDVLERVYGEFLKELFARDGEKGSGEEKGNEEMEKGEQDGRPLSRLRRTKLVVKHGQLANNFACWGSWEGCEEWGSEE